MQKVYSKGMSGWSQLALFLCLVGFGILAGSIVIIPIWKSMTHGSLLNMEKDMLKPANAAAMQTIQAVSVVFMFLIPTLAFAFLCYRNGWTYLGFNQKILPRQVLIVFLLILCSLPLISFLEEINKAIPLPASLKTKFDSMEKKYNDQVLVMAQVKNWAQYLVALLVVAVLPAVMEEMLFRGVLQNMLTRWTKLPWLALIITSCLFSAIHFSWYGFLPRFGLGMLLGIIFLYTGSLWLSILLHFVNNAIVLTALFVMSSRGISLEKATGDSFPFWVGAIGLLLVIALLRWLIKTSPPLSFEEENVSISTRNPFDEPGKNLQPGNI